MPRINMKVQNPPKRDEIVTGFLGGLNTFQDQTLIRDSELTEAKNILLSVDGIEPRPGTLNYKTSMNSRVLGGIGFYLSAGTREFIRFSGNTIKKYVGNTPTDIAAQTYSTTAPMNFLQARDKIFTFNGIDPLSFYDNSTLTVLNAILSPSTPGLVPLGTPGTSTYSYRVSAFNAYGETLASSSITISNGAASLNATNFNLLTWGAVSGAVGYNIWGRTATGLGHTYLATVYATDLYNDDIVDADINTGTDLITVTRDCTTGDEVKWSGSGVMPTGVSAGTSYWVIRISATTIKLATSLANALAGTPVVDITAVGSGTRTLTWQTVLQYKDQGQDDPSLVLLPPEGNTTDGIRCKFAVFAIGRIFAAGDPNNPSRLYYGGVGTNIANFSGATEGGGYVDVFKNDGALIRSILPFQGGVIVWKDNAVYKFSFTSTGLPQLEEITRSFGGISFRGCKHVENDVVFPARKDGRLAYYSLGNQENYSSAILRTNELSIKIASRLTNVNLSYLPNAAAFYYNNVYGCAVATEDSTVNNRVWCLDTRFGAWVYWEGFKPNFFMTYVDTDGSEALYYGDEVTGYMVEMFREERNDNGVAIAVSWALKAFTQKLFHKYKRYYNPTFQFKDITVSGAINGQIYVDGNVLSAGFEVNVPTAGGAGMGSGLWGQMLFGEAPGGQSTDFESASDIVVEAKTIKTGRSIKYAFNSETVDARYKFLSAAHRYQVLDGKRLRDQFRTYVD